MGSCDGEPDRGRKGWCYDRSIERWRACCSMVGTPRGLSFAAGYPSRFTREVMESVVVGERLSVNPDDSLSRAEAAQQ